MFEVRPYRNEDLALLPPRPDEVEDAKLERELKWVGEQRLANPAFTLWGGHFATEPIGAGGIIIFQPHAGEAWIRGSTRMEAHRMVAARLIQRHLRRVTEIFGLWRVQMMVRTMTPAGNDIHRAYELARWLGFEVEGIMRKVGPGGEDYYMMAWLPGGGE